MFQKTKNTVQQGSVGLAAAIFYYQKLGWIVSIPTVDNQSYDLIVDNGTKLMTVQVKTSKYKQNGSYIVCIRRIRVNTTETKIHPMDKCDLVFVLCEDGSVYSVPYDKVTGTELRLNAKYNEFKVDNLNGNNPAG